MTFEEVMSLRSQQQKANDFSRWMNAYVVKGAIYFRH